MLLVVKWVPQKFKLRGPKKSTSARVFAAVTVALLGKDKRISKDKLPSVCFLFYDVILDLSKYKHHELVFNSCYKHALRCVMTMMVLDSYLLKKYFLAFHNACVQFSGVTTVVISQFVI